LKLGVYHRFLRVFGFSPANFTFRGFDAWTIIRCYNKEGGEEPIFRGFNCGWSWDCGVSIDVSDFLCAKPVNHSQLCTGCGGVGWRFIDDFLGCASFPEEATVSLKKDSVLAGVWTTAANAGFILWWLTIGTTLILNAKLFGLLGFSVFAGVHWIIDFSWYTVVALLIFKSQRFWTERTRMGITLFCVAVFIGFGAYFMGSAVWSLLA